LAFITSLNFEDHVGVNRSFGERLPGYDLVAVFYKQAGCGVDLFFPNLALFVGYNHFTVIKADDRRVERR
jgi:hypothetical protein